MMNFETLSQWRRSAFCAAMATRNTNHVYLFSDISDKEATTFDKLLSKTWAFLQGELKSIDNLERFFNEFDQWQNELLEGQDSFGAEAAQQTCQSLYSASYALLDETANDCDLVVLSNQQLLAEFAELGNESEELIDRQKSFEQAIFDLLTAGKPKRETIISVQALASSEEESSLGITLA
jgi:uncharacterized protein YjaG (DUF416 family)